MLRGGYVLTCLSLTIMRLVEFSNFQLKKGSMVDFVSGVAFLNAVP